MASRVVAVERTHEALVVTIRHLDTDSFSRSVDRAGKKAWLADPTRGSITYTSGSYAHTDVGHRNCLSTLVYAASFEKAREALFTRGLPFGV